MGSETLYCTCYIFSDESSVAFYSTSTGYGYSSFNFNVQNVIVMTHYCYFIPLFIIFCQAN